MIDIVGPLPTTTSGYRYLLTLLCPATKFPEAVPLREATSVNVDDALLTIFSRLGFPAEVQCDQGAVFTSELTTTVLQKCGIKLIHSSVYHPQSNSVEKWHSVLKRVLRALCWERKLDWEACLPATLFALRTAPHEATGFAPAELAYGRNLRSSLHMLRELWEDRCEESSVVEHVLGLLDRMSVTQEIVRVYLEDAQKKAKAYYDQRARLRKFKVGDKVIVLRPCRHNRLEVQWEGPVEVVFKLSETNYAVRTSRRKKELAIYHCNLMKPYVQRGAVVNMSLNSPEEMPLEVPFSIGDGGDCSVDELMSKALHPAKHWGSGRTEELAFRF